MLESVVSCHLRGPSRVIYKTKSFRSPCAIALRLRDYDRDPVLSLVTILPPLRSVGSPWRVLPLSASSRCDRVVGASRSPQVACYPCTTNTLVVAARLVIVTVHNGGMCPPPCGGECRRVQAAHGPHGRCARRRQRAGLGGNGWAPPATPPCVPSADQAGTPAMDGNVVTV